MPKPTELAREIENFSETEWIEFLNELDGVSRRRQERAPAEREPTGASRDEVAAWIAKQHFAADRTVKEIWYLPTGSPPDEIRLVELNGFLAGEGWGVQPVDFAIGVKNVEFKLMIADTTTEELERAKNDPSILPPGWSLSDAKIWRRGI